MKRLLFLCLFWLLLTASALAEPEHNLRMDDPLARLLVCTGAQEARMLGPHYARVSVFSVPEPDGRGERLFVGYVDDIWDRHSLSLLWRGPVATRWKRLRTVPEYTSSYSAPNPERYRIDRLTALPGGRVQTDIMEIDLEAKPALLRLVGGPGQPMYPASQPLGESLPMNDSLRLLVRLSEQQSFNTDVLSLRSYAIAQGEAEPPANRFTPFSPWALTPDSHLLSVCRLDAPGQGSLHFLPMRIDGWKTEKLLAQPAVGDLNGRFVLQMLARYTEPDDAGQLISRAARYRVGVDLKGVSITTLERGLYYHPMHEDWISPKTKRDPKAEAAF